MGGAAPSGARRTASMEIPQVRGMEGEAFPAAVSVRHAFADVLRGPVINVSSTNYICRWIPLASAVPTAP